MAASEDGQTFTPTQDIFAQNAGAPALARLPNDHLLAVFEQAEQQAGSSGKDAQKAPDRASTVTTQLAVSRSRDGGKTWLAARPVKLTDVSPTARVGSPSLVVMPSGLVRMYFAVAEEPERSRARGKTFIGSAVTRDGAEWQIDRRVRVPCEGLAWARIVAFPADRKVILLISPDDRPDRATTILRFASADGRSFGRPERAMASGIGQVLRFDHHHWRMFVNSDNAIRSRLSNDAIRWHEETQERLRGGFDAAVATTADDKYLMLFCSNPGQEQGASAGSVSLTSGRTTHAGVPSDASGQTSEHSGEQSANLSEVPSGEQAANSAGESGPGSATDGSGWEAFTAGGYEAELGAAWTGGNTGQAGGSGDGLPRLAPVPDFSHKVDYIDWYTRNCLAPDDQNAFYSYGSMLEAMEQRVDQFKDPLNERGDHGPPGPWDPAAHPEWDESYLATQDLLDQYFTAANDGRVYNAPLRFPENTVREYPLIIDHTLPGLRGMRTAAKASLAQAWRAPEGQVDPDRMIGAFDAVLGNANHLQQGATLIENLVSAAERNLVGQNARWALHHGVFESAEQIEGALNVLREKDLPSEDPGKWVLMEHAAIMDVLQYAFESPTPGGEPEIRMDRAVPLFEMLYSGPPDDEDLAMMGSIRPDEVRDAVTKTTQMFEEMLDHCRNRFPYEDAGHFDQTAEQIAEQNRVVGGLLPSLARANEILRRTEASRRATQLVYSIELFKARNGRYPGSLDELPYEQVYDVRTDPYSSQDFAYRVTENGPLIYSLSRNGQDDGGVHSPRWGDTDTDSDDYVFWPPQEK